MDCFESSPNVPLSYGTGGFRGNAEMLRPAFARCGAVAALRSESLKGLLVGVMITASHNEESDNGVKITERDGSMLEAEWEKLAENLVNSVDGPKAVAEFAKEIRSTGHDVKGKVVIGRDTRRSSPALAAEAKSGSLALHAEVIDLGVVTTPELHWFVRSYNANGRVEGTYRDWLASHVPRTMSILAVDCANGVGALALREILEKANYDEVKLFNTGEGVLNSDCGADFVQKALRLPLNQPTCDRSATLDGDADRLVYYRSNSEGCFELMDGDKILALVVSHLCKLTQGSSLRVGAVHTAYTNGACVQFLRGLENVEVVCAKTGVKHLEVEAKKFDLGAYWEPNGHGTVLFSENAFLWMQQTQPNDAVLLANQAVGDGIANLLMIETIFASNAINFEDVLHRFDAYASVNQKLIVPDKTIFRTAADNEQILISPAGLQGEIDKAVRASNFQARAFVRPSGTEEVVRIYAESSGGLEKADELASQLGELINQFSNA